MGHFLVSENGTILLTCMKRGAVFSFPIVASLFCTRYRVRGARVFVTVLSIDEANSHAQDF